MRSLVCMWELGMGGARYKLIDAGYDGAESTFVEAVCDLRLFSEEEQVAGGRCTPAFQASETIALSFARS